MARLPITTITKTSTSEVTLNYLTAVNGTPAADQFRSTITGRSKMIDLSTDMLPRMGVERIMTQSIMRVDGEIGPAGEAVYKPVNDKYDQIRFVGGWNNVNQGTGQYAHSTPAGSSTNFIEITFYGTGLNMLIGYLVSNVQDIDVSVDGGSTSSYTTGLKTEFMANRNYSNNGIVNIASGLSLGMHTVKIISKLANTYGITASGFEILNESSSIKVGAGQVVSNGVARTIAAHTSAYNSGFESGTLGTRGGRVLVYAKRDGTIGKAVTPTDASSLTLTSTNHVNEEVIRSYFWREFGAGRTDDFSTVVAALGGARAFALDDGTTTLVASQTYATANGGDGLLVEANGGFLQFTFVGTGLDLRLNQGGTDAVTWQIDGVSIGTTVPNSASNLIFKIASGLPYGTHTLKMTRNAFAVQFHSIANFIVYGPKKPTIPAGAMELADYNILGNFSAASAVVNTAVAAEAMSQGVIRKANAREMVYAGSGWAVPIDVSTATGWRIQTNTITTDYVEYTFVGTGFDLRYALFSNNATSATVSVDGVTNLSGAGYTTGFYGGTLFTASTGVLNQNLTSGAGVGGAWVTGLAYGMHKVKVTYTAGGAAMRIDAFDIITPIHTHKNNGPVVVQNTLSVGSQGINDGRKFGSQLIAPKNVSQALGVTSGPTTTATTLVPMPDMSIAIKTAGNPIRISYSHYVQSNNAAAYTYSQLMVDGVIVGTIKAAVVPNAQYPLTISDSLVVPVAAGSHTVVLGWYTTAGTMVGINNSRNLTVEEIANS